MKIQLHNRMSGETFVIEGNAVQVDAQLRQHFPHVMLDVAHGDVAHGVYEVSRLYHYSVEVIDGALPAMTPPSNAVEYDQPEPVDPQYPQADLPEPESFAKSVDEWLENDSLAKMAIKDLQPGRELPPASTYRRFDYSHLLSEGSRAKGFTVGLTHASNGALHTQAEFNGHPAGYLATHINPDKTLAVRQSDVEKDYRGRGIGKALYEATYAHAFHNGVRSIYGGVHSTLAHHAHNALAAKHGLEYKATPRTPEAGSENGEYDGAFHGYEYALKSEKEPKHNLEKEINVNNDLVQDMLGFQPHNHSAFDTARLMSGGPLLSLEQIRRALYEEDGNLERASLRAYGIDPNEKNIKALRDLSYIARLGKSEEATPKNVAPGTPEADDAAEAIGRAFKERSAQKVSLNGKYSKGAMIAKDPKTNKVYLLKPASDGNSPAKGVKEEPASQPRREAAFSHIAASFGLGDDIARADLIYIDGNEWAAIELLPFSYKSLERRWKMDRPDIYRLLERYRQRGTLHKWAIIDYILGNPDRHGQNMMVGGDVDRPQNEVIKLIDHGSAFAGKDFDPAFDKNSFVPFYLRYIAPDKFNSLPVKDKLKVMPRLPEDQEKNLSHWFHDLTAAKLQGQLEHFGINPIPCLTRLAKLHIVAGPIDQVINKMWVGSEPT